MTPKIFVFDFYEKPRSLKSISSFVRLKNLIDSQMDYFRLGQYGRYQCFRAQCDVFLSPKLKVILFYGQIFS